MALNDMLMLSIKAMGINPDALMQQASGLGEAFARIVANQEAQAATLARIEANQAAVMIALGLAVPPPDAAMLALIEDQSAEHIRRIETVTQ